jgi:molybdate/tungstate transport system ATP-binding protein
MIRLEGVSVRAGAFEVREVSVAVPQGAWGIVLGPAGSGKSTLLDAIAGVRPLSAGRLSLRGEDARGVPPERRGVGLVHPHSFLFPHLGVAENIGYGARDAEYANDIARRFGADALSARPVRSLSGGERQVVALARALAPRPDIVLLDEPFAALDPRTRTRVRSELRALQREQGLTVLQVTHDFAEAGTLGDLAILLEGGRLVQSDVPSVLFRRPATSAAAEFLGAENIFAGTVRRRERGSIDGPDILDFHAGAVSLVAVGSMADGPAHAVVRGEEVSLSREGTEHGSPRNVLRGVVVEIAVDGVVARVTLDVQGLPLVAVVTSAAASELRLEPGAWVLASIKANAIHLC